ncbi:MAG TPA: response regulator [Candidatus Binatia bacterium]
MLLVEDNPDTRDALQALLTAHGYRVVCAIDGAEALTLARRDPRPCIIVLDLMMPRVDGYEFRRAQFADPAIRDIPVVAASGIHDLARRARELGVTHYLQKPLDMDELFSMIERQCACRSRP